MKTVKLESLTLYECFRLNGEYYRIIAISKRKYYKTILCQDMTTFHRKWFDKEIDVDIFVYPDDFYDKDKRYDR